MATPGPSHLLMLANSVECGFKKSLATAAGDLSANFLQMLIASLGLVSVIHNAKGAFVYVKWAGVAYLVYLGLKLFFSNPEHHLSSVRQQRSASSLYWQGFITSAANPKAVIFFASLFPLFINPEQPLRGQFLALSLTYLFVDGSFLTFYGKFAELIASKLKDAHGQYFSKVCALLVIGAAILLGFKDMQTQINI